MYQCHWLEFWGPRIATALLLLLVRLPSALAEGGDAGGGAGDGGGSTEQSASAPLATALDLEEALAYCRLTKTDLQAQAARQIALAHKVSDAMAEHVVELRRQACSSSLYSRVVGSVAELGLVFPGFADRRGELQRAVDELVAKGGKDALLAGQVSELHLKIVEYSGIIAEVIGLWQVYAASTNLSCGPLYQHCGHPTGGELFLYQNDFWRVANSLENMKEMLK